MLYISENCDKIHKLGGIEVLKSTGNVCKTKEIMSDLENVVKCQLRDSIFTQLFRDKSNLVELYKALPKTP